MLKPPTLQEAAPPPPLISKEVQDKALKKIQALAKGNGIRPETISIADVSAQMLGYEAGGFVRLATQYTSQTLPGKIDKGEAIGTPQAFEAALRNMTVETQRDSGKRQTILDIILKRPDKGYGARDQVVKLDALSRDFVSHEPCSACNQTGKSSCGKCAGKGVMSCQTCHGRQSTLCPSCRGNGTVTMNGRTNTCMRCRGKTRVQCVGCQGRGQAKCKNCNGTGSAPCARCKASGYLSHLAHVDLIGHLHFNYDRQGLPIELTKLLDAFATRYIEKKDIDLTIHTYDYDEKEPAENIPIGYHVRVPYGEITLNLGKKKAIPVTILGMNGEPIKAPGFLDDLTRPGQQDLEKAAKGQGNVGETLRLAARYRMLRESIVVAAGSGQTREKLSKLLQKYPVGISSEKLLRFLMQASQAMQIITRKPRLLGLGLGAVMFAALAAGYFFGLRGWLTPQLANLPVDPKISLTLSDMALVPIGTIAGILASRAIAARALKTALTGLASPATIRAILPKIGWTVWAACGLSLGVTAVFYFMTILK